MQSIASGSLPPHNAIEVLLEAFACHKRYLPPGAHVLASPDDLPLRLRAHARNLDHLSGWRAWADDVRFWFVVGRLCGPEQFPGGLLALEISFFDPDDQFVAAGEWALQLDGNWTLRRVIDSADRVCHHARHSDKVLVQP